MELRYLRRQKGKQLVVRVSQKHHPVLWKLRLACYFPSDPLASFLPCCVLQAIRSVCVPHHIHTFALMELLSKLRQSADSGLLLRHPRQSTPLTDDLTIQNLQVQGQFDGYSYQFLAPKSSEACRCRLLLSRINIAIALQRQIGVSCISVRVFSSSSTLLSSLRFRPARS